MDQGPACAGGPLPDMEDIHPAPQEPPSAPKGSVDWQQQWYPLVPLFYLDRGRPFAFTLLGHKLVAWWDRSAGGWKAFEDRCPHRLAPLSEGRINPTTGHLQCSYHGWQFNAAGCCVALPQADSERQLEVAATSRRACVASYPVQAEQGLLWVWMDASPGAAEASAKREVALPSELLDGSGVLLGDWYMRDLPVSYEYLLENLVDPSHIHWAHHGVIGNRSRAGPLKLELEGDVTAQGGFTVAWVQSQMASATAFVPPCFTWLKLRPKKSARFSLLFYAVPVAPGQSRIVAGYSTNALPPLARRALQSRMVAPLLRGLQFLSCLGAHEVLDGDTLFIRAQEQNALAGGRGWKDSYFMPARSDRGVAVLRRWLEREGGGGPAYGPHGAPLQALPPMSRQQILDRYGQHTQHCPSCRRALSAVRGLRGVLSVAATTGIAAGASLALAQATLLSASGSSNSPAPSTLASPAALLAPLLVKGSMPLALLASAALCGLARRYLGRLERRLVFTDYLHFNK